MVKGKFEYFNGEMRMRYFAVKVFPHNVQAENRALLRRLDIYRAILWAERATLTDSTRRKLDWQCQPPTETAKMRKLCLWGPRQALTASDSHRSAYILPEFFNIAQKFKSFGLFCFNRKLSFNKKVQIQILLPFLRFSNRYGTIILSIKSALSGTKVC